MNQEDSRLFFKGGLAFGLSIGALIGSYGVALLKDKKTVSPETVLNHVKNAFLKEGPIEGSWIESKKRPQQKFAITQEIYYGGINRLEDGKIVQYEFSADAKTGSVIEIHRL